jgi:hypothetical protein
MFSRRCVLLLVAVSGVRVSIDIPGIEIAILGGDGLASNRVAIGCCRQPCATAGEKEKPPKVYS